MKWVSINDQLPKLGNWYLVLTKCGAYDILFLDYIGGWHDAKLCRPQDRVTHWCSLPPLPNKVKIALEKAEFMLACYYSWPKDGALRECLGEVVSLLKEHLNEQKDGCE